MMKLYNYWRSSASWRVRIALHIKGLVFEYVPVHLVQREQKSLDHHARNPMEQVPALELELGGQRVLVAQSIAILELLEELYPNPALLPADPYLRARTRELAEIVNSGIQPHQNLSPMQRIDELAPQAGKAHAKHFNELGLAAFEERVRDIAGRFCVGDAPTFADLCLIPQLNAARRMGVEDLEARCPTLLRIEAACNELPAFRDSQPDTQPDAPTSNPTP
jgi:maleylpyruvate isomerase